MYCGIYNLDVLWDIYFECTYNTIHEVNLRTIYGVDSEGSRSLRWGYWLDLRLQRSEAETIREKNITVTY